MIVELLKRAVEWLKGSRLSKNKVGQFILEVLIEMVGVTWPGKDEIVSSTVVVVITLVVTAAFLYVVGVAISPAIDWFGQLLAMILS